jgi:hypothetical protein
MSIEKIMYVNEMVNFNYITNELFKYQSDQQRKPLEILINKTI